VLAPAGTVANAARVWGQRAGLLPTLSRVCSGKLPPARERPTLRVTASGAERVGFTFGTGLVARFFERYYAEGAGGNRAAVRIALRTFASSLFGGAYASSVLDPLPCEIEADGLVLAPRAWSLVVASVLDDVGIGMRVTYRGGEDPARPHLVATPLTARELGPQAPRVLLGRPLRGEGVFDAQVRRAVVRFPGQDGPWVLDGDLERASEVTIGAGPIVRIVSF
jgi:hypothetical protein